MILIDYKDSRPIYQQLVQRLSELMLKGVLSPDEKLPSVRSLAAELSINPNTIQRAYLELEREGYIYSIKGRGSFVSDLSSIKLKKKDEIFEELHSLTLRAAQADISEEEVTEHIRQSYKKFKEERHND